MVRKGRGETWEIRAARNQSMFRAVNDHLTGDGAAAGAEKLVIACECADPQCTETLEITPSEYEQIRASANRFAVRDGHVYPDVEDVVESSERFLVVSKRGEGGKLATALDPRGYE